MDTEQGIDKQLLSHAARQTKALESINLMVTIMFVMGLIGAAIWLIALLRESGILA